MSANRGGKPPFSVSFVAPQRRPNDDDDDSNDVGDQPGGDSKPAPRPRPAPAAASAAAVTPDRCSLVHGGHTCKALTAPGATHIVAQSYARFFDERVRIVIPRFQRTYAWLAEKQGALLLTDLTKNFGKVPETGADSMSEDRRVLIRHGTGKLIVQSQNYDKTLGTSTTASAGTNGAAVAAVPIITCIDGQQRVTTLSLLFAAMHELAHTNLPGESECAQLVSLLDGMLFVDVAAATAWADTVAAALAGPADDLAHVWRNVEDPGELPKFGHCPGMRLVPSHADCAAYNEIMTRRLLHRRMQRRGAPADARFAHIAPLTEATAQSLQGRMFSFFLSALRSFLATEVGDAGDAAAVLFRLARHVVLNTGFVRIELLSQDPRDANQVFLFFQLQGLFSLGALLWNPHPGEGFGALDCVRNLLLLLLIGNDASDASDAAHREKWLKPIELPLRAAIQAFNNRQAPPPRPEAQADDQQQLPAAAARVVTADDCVAMYCIKQEALQQAGGAGVFKSKWRGEVCAMLAAFDGKMEHPKDSSAIELYTRFHSVFELRLAAAGAVESDVANTILSELAVETQRFVARLAATQGPAAEWIPSWRSQVAARPVYD